MECVLTRSTSLIRHLSIRSHDAVTDRTLSLSLQRTLDVPPPSGQRIDERTVENGNSTQRSAQPRLPLLLVDGNAVEALNVGVCERESRRQADAHGHGLLVENV